jgi:NADH-quinone oxidoreductase subunit F
VAALGAALLCTLGAKKKAEVPVGPQPMGIIPGTTICGLADGAAWPGKNAITKCRAEFEEYIRAHQAGPRQVTRLQEAIAHGAPVDPTNTALAVLPSPGGGLRPPHAN